MEKRFAEREIPGTYSMTCMEEGCKKTFKVMAEGMPGALLQFIELHDKECKKCTCTQLQVTTPNGDTRNLYSPPPD